jgi:hypothetical protein
VQELEKELGVKLVKNVYTQEQIDQYNMNVKKNIDRIKAEVKQ